MVNAAVAECYAVLVEKFGSMLNRPTAHRGADYRRAAGQTMVAYEACTVVDSDLYSKYLGYSLVAKRHRDNKFIGWAHIRKGTRPSAGTVLAPGDSVGLVAGFGDDHGSSWDGPHIHTTEGSTADHIYVGTNTDPAPDIAAAVSGGSTPAGGGPTGLVNHHWYQITPEAMGALQNMMNALKIYGGVDGGTGPVDNDFGKNSVMGMQELGKRWGYLAGDYEVDGVPHNPDQEAPSNYGFFLQKWAKDKAGYDGLEDGLPAGRTSGYLVAAANKVISEVTPAPPVTLPPVVISPPVVTPPPVPVSPIPDIPPVPEGFVFLPDLGSSQGDFDFAEYAAKGGRHTALKFGGGNASDSPYIAPRYKDQLTRARTRQQKLIHYWFNGNKNGLTPETSADYFAKNIDLAIGEIVAIDVENETDTGTIAWTPAEAVRYIKRLRTYFPGIKGLVYMSDALADSGEWDEVVALGWELWSASWGSNNGDPGTPPVTDDWSHFTAWQYSSEEMVPGNYSGNPKVYRRTDGNMAKADTWIRLGWTVPVVVPEPDPEPTPVPGEFLTRAQFKEFIVGWSDLNLSFADKL